MIIIPILHMEELRQKHYTTFPMLHAISGRWRIQTQSPHTYPQHLPTTHTVLYFSKFLKLIVTLSEKNKTCIFSDLIFWEASL